jgi:hypothetical protein
MDGKTRKKTKAVSKERRGYWNLYIRYNAVFQQVVKNYLRLLETERGRNRSACSVKPLDS